MLRRLSACPLGVLLFTVATAAVIEVSFKVPVKSRIDLQGRKTVTIVPFMVVRNEGEGGSAGVDVHKEFVRYLEKLIRRHTRLKYIEAGEVKYPSHDLTELATDVEFWTYVGE